MFASKLFEAALKQKRKNSKPRIINCKKNSSNQPNSQKISKTKRPLIELEHLVP